MRLRLSLWESHHNRQAFEPCSVCYIQSPNPEFWCCAAIQILEAVLAVLALGSWRMGRMGEHLAALHPVLHSKACVLFYLKLVQKNEVLTQAVSMWHAVCRCPCSCGVTVRIAARETVCWLGWQVKLYFQGEPALRTWADFRMADWQPVSGVWKVLAIFPGLASRLLASVMTLSPAHHSSLS